MAQSSEADRYLIELIRRGDADGWAQLVARYQGRLLAFARSHLARKSEAEDLVQETFFMFLKSLHTFKDECGIESYLFTILRRKVIDLYRGKKLPTCFLNDLNSGVADSSAIEERLASSEPTASWYARRDEQAERMKALLALAIDDLVGRLKKGENFRDLKIIEMLFFGQIRNKVAADVAGIDEKQIGLIKHRMIKALREKLAGTQESMTEPADSLLTEVWEEWRFTCPKRSTIGRFLLGTLEEPWTDYLEFHINRLGCRFCRANVDDLQKASETEQQAFQKRIFDSTIGFGQFSAQAQRPPGN